MEFLVPEYEIMRQYDDTTLKQAIVIGAGVCNIYKYFDTRKRIWMGELNPGELRGETQLLFDSEPTYSLETKTYCTIGAISKNDFLDMCSLSPEFK